MKHAPPRILLVLAMVASLGACQAPGTTSEPKPENNRVAAVSPSADPADPVVARVGGRTITASELQAEMLRRGADFLGGYEENARKQKLLDELVEREVLAQAAEQAGYANDPEIVRLHRRMMGERFWQSQLRELDVDEQVSDEELRKTYDAQIERFTETERARASVIFLKAPANATPEQREELKKRAELVRADARSDRPDAKPFDVLARERSADQASSLRGGDMGWFPKGARVYRWEPQVLDAIFQIGKVGEVAELIETDRGVYVLKLTDLKPAVVKPFDEVKRQLQGEVVAERKKSAQSARLATLRGRIDISIDQTSLAGVTPPKAPVGIADGPPAFPVGAAPRTDG